MRLFYFISIFIIVLAVISFFSIPTLRELKRSRVIENEISVLELEAERLNSKNNFLKEKIDYLKSDHYKESVAKDRLSLRNLGEKIVVVSPNSKVLGVSSEKENEIAKEGSVDENAFGDMPNYKKWWKLISRQ
jgi:cell division protein FtsB